MGRLLEVGRLLSSKLELSELLHTIMPLAARVVDADRASLFLVNPKTQELYFDVALGLDPEVAKIRLKMGQGIAGTVAQRKKPIIINDARTDPRWFSKPDEKSGYVTRSIIAVPLILRDRCIGVVEGINRKTGQFTLNDLRVFEAFASQAAVAIDNARLFASLKEERLTLNTLLNEMTDAAVLTDGRGDIILANDAAKRFFTKKDGPFTVADATAGMKLTPPWEEVIASTEPIVHFEAERDIPKKLVLAGTASLIHTESNEIQGRVIVFRDITEEKYEEGLKRSFLSLISHKLKTPLSSITGYSQLLLADLKDKEDAGITAKALRAINTQGTKLTGLVEKLLNFTVLEGLDASESTKETIGVDEALREAVESLGPWLEEHNGQVEVKSSADLKAIGDPTLLKDALRHLIENGIKFTPNGEEGSERKVTLSARTAGENVEICVKDWGPGIPPEEREKIFKKFYQVESSFTGQVEGWGLGLPFVRKVVEKLDGSVRLESKIGKGTTFFLTLPAAKP